MCVHKRVKRRAPSHNCVVVGRTSCTLRISIRTLVAGTFLFYFIFQGLYDDVLQSPFMVGGGGEGLVHRH